MRCLLALLLIAFATGCVASAQDSPTLHRLSKGYVTVYALEGPEGVVLVDSHNAGEEGWVLRQLARRGIAPEDVTLILLTHGHMDHAGSAAALREATGAPIAVGAGDVDLIDGTDTEGPGDQATDWRGRTMARLLDTSLEPFTPDLIVEERLSLEGYGISAEARVVGGHTEGSTVVLLPTGQALTGDLVRGRMLRRRAPTLHLFHEDQRTAHDALRGLIDEGVAAICSAHDRCMSAERVGRWLEGR